MLVLSVNLLCVSRETKACLSKNDQIAFNKEKRISNNRKGNYWQMGYLRVTCDPMMYDDIHCQVWFTTNDGITKGRTIQYYTETNEEHWKRFQDFGREWHSCEVGPLTFKDAHYDNMTTNGTMKYLGYNTK